jgi:hypothetical protein
MDGERPEAEQQEQGMDAERRAVARRNVAPARFRSVQTYSSSSGGSIDGGCL